jgi:4-hydroxythreonine-4-phosphate dehydrogenase
MSQRPRLILTSGDRDGIGVEILAQLFAEPSSLPDADYLLIGDENALRRAGLKAKLVDHASFGAREAPTLLAAPQAGPQSVESIQGYQCGWAIERATRLALDGEADAIVTGPISKERLQDGGFAFQGHTDFLAKLCDRERVTMMLANTHLRVSLSTTHVPLAKVSQTLTQTGLEETIEQTAHALRQDFGIERPRIVVCGLNPHAGENGRMGSEEKDIIEPAIAKVSQRDSDLLIAGPTPADTLFAQIHMGRVKTDAVVAMYHDQGLTPVKLLDFPNTVNITLGLPIIRTSVDHGVGFDIAGKGVSDPSSFRAAVHHAVTMFGTRARSSCRLKTSRTLKG